MSESDTAVALMSLIRRLDRLRMDHPGRYPTATDEEWLLFLEHLEVFAADGEIREAQTIVRDYLDL